MEKNEIIIIIISLLRLCSTFKNPMVQNKELVFVVSGNSNFGGHPQNMFKAPILDIIKFCSEQFQGRQIIHGVVWANANKKFHIVSNMSSDVTEQERNLMTWIRNRPISDQQQLTGLAGAIEFAQTSMFTKSTNSYHIIVAITHYQMGLEDMKHFLRYLCKGILTYVLVFPWRDETCEDEGVRNSIRYMNVLLNYSRLLHSKMAICGRKIEILEQFRYIVFAGIQEYKVVENYCKKNPKIRDIFQIEFGLDISTCNRWQVLCDIGLGETSVLLLFILPAILMLLCILAIGGVVVGVKKTKHQYEAVIPATIDTSDKSSNHSENEDKTMGSNGDNEETQETPLSVSEADEVVDSHEESQKGDHSNVNYRKYTRSMTVVSPPRNRKLGLHRQTTTADQDGLFSPNRSIKSKSHKGHSKKNSIPMISAMTKMKSEDSDPHEGHSKVHRQRKSTGTINSKKHSFIRDSMMATMSSAAVLARAQEINDQ